jgi:1,4-dihydroxy-2-naphthoate octaprenyltransferase
MAFAYGAWVSNILVINGLPDAASDRACKKHTLAVILGPHKTSVLYLTLAVMSLGLAAVAQCYSTQQWPVWVSALSLAPATYVSHAMWRSNEHTQSLRAAIMVTIAITCALGIMWSVLYLI